MLQSMREDKSWNWIVVGAATGFLGVGLGAFGAHGLAKVETEEGRAWGRTGVLYHLVHAPVLVLVGMATLSRPGRQTVGLTFLIGVAVFSGTLYAMALGAPRWLGAVTPLGGLALMAGWVLLALGARRRGDPS